MMYSFVDRKFPLASDIDIDLTPFLTTAIEISFCGVLKKRQKYAESICAQEADVDDTEDCDDCCEEEEEEEDDTGGDCDATDAASDHEKEVEHDCCAENLLTPGALQERLRKILIRISADGFVGPDKDTIARSLYRHRIKITEDVEDEPHNIIGEQLVLESALLRCAPPGATLGDHIKLDRHFNELALEPPEYWVNLLRKWLVDAPCIEVFVLRFVTVT